MRKRIKAAFLGSMPGVAVLLALFAFLMMGYGAYLERDWIKGVMVIVAVIVLAVFVYINRNRFPK